jgi:putative acetyltransferase
MLIRHATSEDAEGFATAWAAVAYENRWIATEPPVEVDALAARVRQMLADGSTLLVLDDGRRIAGTLKLSKTHADGVVGLGMSVLADVRGQGWGPAMLRAAIDHARGAGCHKIELEVWPDNERAITLYERFGFEVEGLRRDHYRRRDGSLRSAQIMALLLT